MFSAAAFPQESEYQLDLSEFEKKTFRIGGFFEVEPILLGLDQNAALYKLAFFDRDEGGSLGQANLGLRLEASFEKGIFSGFARTESFLRYDGRGWDTRLDLLEGYVTLKPHPGIALDIGKKVTRWGTGYFRNVVSFVDRPKDPEDPQEALEGFFVVSADFIKSFRGPVKTVAFTPVVLPVTEDVNREFGAPGHVNFAAKLYLLMWDTDVDLVFLTGGSRSTRYGLDIARNIRSNFEVHGELAWITDAPEFSLDDQGELSVVRSDVMSAIAGFRYLTSSQITLIAEYYHNGPGISEEVYQDFLQLIDDAHGDFLSGGGRELLQRAQSLSPNFTGANPMRDYLYFRASQKEPFDILYFTPGISSIVNLRDHSFSLIPEVQYSPKANLNLRFRAVFLVGDEGTEYGERPADYRLEIRARYFF